MRIKSAALLALLGFSATMAFAQGGFGKIEGHVTDPSGASVAGAVIVATQSETGTTTKSISTSAGAFTLEQLRPGTYSLSTEVAGFKKLERNNITVRVGDDIALNLALQIGEPTQTIQVDTEAPLLQDNATEGDNISQEDIMHLPVVDHDPLELARLSSNFQGSGQKNDPENRINGGRPLGMEYFVDGVAVETGLGHQTVSNTPTMQDTSEFKVVTNGLSAEYGRMSGGFVEVVTKSGGNQVHGQIFEYDQNRVFDAASWGQNAQGVKPGVFQYNLYGGAIGGPIWIPKVYDGHNKTFFYFDYQGRRQNRAGQAQLYDVPTQAMRNGDLSDDQVNGVFAKIYNQNSPIVCVEGATHGSPGVVTPYVPGQCAQTSGPDALGNAADTGGPARSQLIGDGVHIPASMIDPVSAALIKLMPLPNHPALATCSFCQNYQGYTNSSGDDERYSGRIDHVITQNQQIYARFSLENDKEIGSSAPYALASANESNIDNGSNATVNYTWSLSPTTLLEARAGYYFNPMFNLNGVDPIVSKTVPIPSVIENLIGAGTYPWTTSAAFPDNSLVGNSSNSYSNDTTYQANISLTKIVGRHTWKFGYEHRRYYDNTFGSGGGWQIADGDTSQRFAYDSSGLSENLADAWGSFLLGQASYMNANGFTTEALNFNYHAAYVQDDFKLSQKLTLDLGVRWEMETPVTERNNNLFFWDPNAKGPFQYDPSFNWNSALTAAGVNPASVPEPQWAKNGAFPNGEIVAADTPEHPSRYGPGYHPLQFAPRIGAAYELTPTTVVRGGVGEMYLSSTGNAAAYQGGGQGFVTSNSLDNGWLNGNVPLVSNVTFSNPAPNPAALVTYTRNTDQANFQTTGGNVVPVAYSLTTHQPREWDWNFSIQRQITPSILMEVQYNGNRGVGLLIPYELSQFPASLYTGGAAASAIYGANIQSPILNYAQTKWGPTQQLAFLEDQYPQYGPVRIMGANLGRSLYNSFVFRTEKRFSHGVGFLGSYTWSRQKDNTGGPNVGADITNSSGTGGRETQSVDQMENDYTISPLDRTNRVIFAGNWDLPIGRGRAFLGSPHGFGRALDYVIGGWQLSGIYTYISGKPVVLGWNNSANSLGHIINTWPTYAPGYTSIKGNTSDPNNTLVNVGVSETYAQGNRIFNPNAVVNAQAFVYGNLNPIQPSFREPGYFDTDIALMKNFAFDADGKRYVQFRAEATNAFNQRGYPQIDANIGDPTFGQEVLNPNSSPYNPRVIQFSGRIIF